MLGKENKKLVSGDDIRNVFTIFPSGYASGLVKWKIVEFVY